MNCPYNGYKVSISMFDDKYIIFQHENEELTTLRNNVIQLITAANTAAALPN